MRNPRSNSAEKFREILLEGEIKQERQRAMRDRRFPQEAFLRPGGRGARSLDRRYFQHWQSVRRVVGPVRLLLVAARSHQPRLSFSRVGSIIHFDVAGYDGFAVDFDSSRRHHEIGATRRAQRLPNALARL